MTITETRRGQRALTLAAVGLLAYWMFGNVYEAVVISPNWVVDNPAQLVRLNEFFVNTGPTWYFVPLGLLGPVLVWVAAWRNRDPDLAPAYRRAGWCVALATALTAVVVTTLLSRLFGADYRSYGAELTSFAWWWNVANVVRIALVATALWSVFSAFRILDRR